MKKEVAFVLALRTIASPCRVDYHAEFHARPSSGCSKQLKCLNCILIDGIISNSFEWQEEENPNQFGVIDGAWRLIT